MRRSTVAKSVFAFAFPVLAGVSFGVAKEVADFHFDEGSGNVSSKVGSAVIQSRNPLPDATDYSQPGPAAGAYGDITLSDADAKAIKSVHFDGKTKLNLGPAKGSPINLTGDFTVTAWVKFDKTDGYNMILATGAGSGNGWKIGVSDGSPCFTANGVADVKADDYTFDTGKWAFMAVTVAGKDGERKITFYVNGKKVNSDALTCDTIALSDVEQMHLGGADNANDADESFSGNVAQLKVFNTVLDSDAIRAAAQTQK